MENFYSQSVLEHISSSVKKHFNSPPFFVIGVSGGPDSMLLMYALHKLKIDALVVHINYGKRGEDSDSDQELVEGLSFEWGFECCSIKLNPNDAGNENFQNWARSQRYQIFRNLKKEFKADAIIVAHHQDDQVETIIQKVLRGSGISAWEGMKEFDGELFRPLLSLSKQEILDFCKTEAIPYRNDESNFESDYARNFLRNKISPKFDKLFPGWKSNVLNLTDKAKAFEEAIHFVSKPVIRNQKLILEEFSSLSESLKPEVLKLFIERKGISPSKGLILELLKIEHLQVGKEIEISTNLSLMRERDSAVIKSNSDALNHLMILKKGDLKPPFRLENFEIGLQNNTDQSCALMIDFELLDWPLTLRQWRPGDKIHLLGSGKTQKISDLLTNKKVSSAKKEKAFVLCGSLGSIYAVIFPEKTPNGELGSIAEDVKIHSNTSQFITIKIID